MRRLLGTLLAAAALTLPLAAQAFAEYPERPVTFIVPWPPGDLEDQLTRIIAEEMTIETGVPAKVVNRPGGGAVEGATAVAQSDPDGYTVGSLVIDVPTMHIIRGNATYTRDSFEPVGIFLTYPFALVALKDAPYNNMAELAEYAKSNPVKLGHFGYDLVPTMATFAAAKQLGFSFGSDAAFDGLDCGTLKNGDVDVMNTTMATVLSCLDDVKVIAAYTETPLSIKPDAKLLSEQVPGMNITLWNGLFVPKGTPQEVKDRLAAIAEKAMKSDKAQEVAKATGAGVYWMNAADAAKRIDQDYADSEALVKALDAK
ncbi:tripartite tricarboxylate transporter substrate binding protein [Mesorhizobium sp. LHD-90]|uniref:tripartite tricarboxylate transporter substrate binding protein n=1 Tax=Mesorhizobium sp. LHD-90 TaxID=3071414 RepID=UPI0027E0D218|nr:tripartite tricarboxylate transporter substrate binding protein [Mesorhizobium sp. LHD-90]MDQ6437492.1 tripartite tricarboxylate transporter substrate binding protein [Mesorhizobium sp. LHD-90]